MSDEKIKILVVDDEESALGFFTEASKRTNIEVRAVNNGRLAIEAVKEDDFSVAFIDTRMPGMNGLETFKEIVKVNPDLSVFMMIVSASDEIFLEAMGAGAKGAIYKPPDLDKIVTTIQEIEVISFFKGELQRALERSKGKETEETREMEDTLREIEETE